MDKISRKKQNSQLKKITSRSEIRLKIHLRERREITKRIYAIVQKTTQKSSGHIYRISCHQRMPSLHCQILPTLQGKPKQKILTKLKSSNNILVACLPLNQEVNSPPLNIGQTNKTIKNITITVEIVRKERIKPNNNKSLGPDEDPPRILKELITYVCGPLALLMNKSMEEGILPNDWKLAYVTHIFKKKGDISKAVNY